MLWIALTTTQPPQHPSLEPVEDVAGLPRVLLIGDSISMGYTVPTRELLADKANVHRVPENGGPTREKSKISLKRMLRILTAASSRSTRGSVTRSGTSFTSTLGCTT